MLRAAYVLPVFLACAAPGPRADPAAAVDTPRQDPSDRRLELKALAYELMEKAEYERLRDVIAQLEELDVEPLLNAARKSLRAGDLHGALSKIEQALEHAPMGPTARVLHGDACLALGRGPHDPARLEAALSSYLMASESPPRWRPSEERREFRARALLGASHAATALGDREQAVQHARACLETVESLGAGSGARLRLDEWPEKRFFDAAFDLYAAVRVTHPERAAELADEMEDALRWPRVRNPEAAWPWTSLSALYLGEQRFEEARTAAFDGLARHPFDRTLPRQLTEAARGLGGSAAVHAALAVVKQRAPSAALPWWYSARERFDVALEELAAAPVVDLARAEDEFRRCRELEPEYEPECRNYEALCRSALGSIQLERGELDAAERSFRSMEELSPGGLGASVPGLLGSGLEGLDRVGREHFERDELDRAAAVYTFLHEYDPEQPAWAVRAGQLQRDAGERLRIQAEAAERLAAHPERDPERTAELLRAAGIAAPPRQDVAGWQAALERAAAELDQRASLAFETSYRAYRAAAELAPDDVRILCDAAELPIHLGRDLEWAEATLLRCVELGEEQRASPALDPEARLALMQAWGDAHENLGVLYLEHKGDKVAALAWFEQSQAIGPDPRPIIEEEYLPRCARAEPAEKPR